MAILVFPNIFKIHYIITIKIIIFFIIMENNQINLITQINLENYNENYIYKLIDLSFQFFDSHIDKEQYEEQVDNFIHEFNQYKPTDSKNNVKFIIDFIEKYSNSEENFLEENLKLLSIFLF